MIRKLPLLLLASLFFTAANAQKLTVVVNYVSSDGQTKNNINYKPGQLLNWADFTGKPIMSSDAAALTNAGFGLKLSFRRAENASQLVINVNCSFSKNESWVKPGNKTAYILNHEQKHFDIAFIHTIAFIQNLNQASFTNKNYAALIEKIYNETAAAMSKTQSEYDGQTSHSRIEAKQAAWDKKIGEQLAEAIKNE